MDPLGITLGILIAAALMAIAVYFIHRQRAVQQSLRTDTAMSSEQRRYLYKQSWRRIFGAVLLILLGAMIFGSVFLDYDPPGLGPENPPAEREVAKQAVRMLSFYLMTMLMILLVILALAVLDFWAVARFGLVQQKQLLQEHQAMLEADLLEYRQRQSQSE
jgi:hypothetical protein